MHTEDDVLVLLAHQDDEVAAIPTLLREAAAAARIWCAYLTDGAQRISSAVRDAETRAALAAVGIDASRIIFLGDARGRIPDGSLAEEIERGASLLDAWLRESALVPSRFYALDWEGGHVDHDASHLIALRVADRFKKPLFVFPLYNAYRRPRSFFRVIDFVPASEKTIEHRLSLSAAFRSAGIIRYYRSQLRTWLALGPGLVVRRLAFRRETIRAAEMRRIGQAPHEGPLLYETLFNVSRERFFSATSRFRERLLQ